MSAVYPVGEHGYEKHPKFKAKLKSQWGLVRQATKGLTLT